MKPAEKGQTNLLIVENKFVHHLGQIVARIGNGCIFTVSRPVKSAVMIENLRWSYSVIQSYGQASHVHVETTYCNNPVDMLHIEFRLCLEKFLDGYMCKTK